MILFAEEWHSPLQLAIVADRAEVVECLINHGADCRVLDRYNNRLIDLVALGRGTNDLRRFPEGHGYTFGTAIARLISRRTPNGESAGQCAAAVLCEITRTYTLPSNGIFVAINDAAPADSGTRTFTFDANMVPRESNVIVRLTPVEIQDHWRADVTWWSERQLVTQCGGDFYLVDGYWIGLGGYSVVD